MHSIVMHRTAVEGIMILHFSTFIFIFSSFKVHSCTKCIFFTQVCILQQALWAVYFCSFFFNHITAKNNIIFICFESIGHFAWWHHLTRTTTMLWGKLFSCEESLVCNTNLQYKGLQRNAFFSFSNYDTIVQMSYLKRKFWYKRQFVIHLSINKSL